MVDPILKFTQDDPLNYQTKINIGCGTFHEEGYINIDNQQSVNPDKVMDLTKKWTFEDNSVDLIKAFNILEHFVFDDWIFIMQEMMRVGRPNALVDIIIPSPTHDSYWSDPTHKLPHIPETYNMLDRRLALESQKHNLGNSLISLFYDVNFEFHEWIYLWDYNTLELLGKKYEEEDEWIKASKIYNNVVEKYRIIGRVKKEFTNN